MWLLALRTMRFRTGGFVGALVAMALGTAIVMACGGLMETGIRGTVAPQRLSATAVVLVGDASYHVPGTDESVILPERVRLPADLVDLVTNVPGVTEAVGDWVFPVTMIRNDVDPPFAAVGHAWSSSTLAPYRISEGRAPVRFGELALDSKLARSSGLTVGDQVDLVIRGVTGAYRVAGVVAPPTSTSQPAVFWPDAQARRLSGHQGDLDAIGVMAATGSDVDELARRIDDSLRDRGVITLTGDHRGLAEFPEARDNGETLIVLSAVFGGMAMMVAMLVVAGMLGLSIQLRQRELALLRAIGATPRQVRRMVVAETAIVATVAIVLGLLPGARLGRWLFERISEHGVVSPALAYRQGWVPAAVAAGTVLLAGLTVAAVAGRRAARTRPAEALAEADLERRWLTPARLMLALVLLGGGVALAIVTAVVMSGPIAASTAAPTVIVFAMGLALLGPGVTRPTIALLRWPLRAIPGPASYLAGLNTRWRTVRVAAVVMPIMLATGIAAGQLYLQTTQATAAERGYAQDLHADLVLRAAADGIPPGVVDAVRELPGVTVASEFVSSTGFVEAPRDQAQGDEGWPLQGISADGAAQIMSLTPVAGTLAALQGDSVALSVDHARELGRGIGDSITMRLGDRARAELRIVALFRARPGFETIVMPSATLAPHTTPGLPSQILVRTRSGTDPDSFIAALRKLAARWPGIEVADRSAMTAAFISGQQIQAWVNYLLVGVIVAYTALAVVSTLIVATGERRRELGMLRLIGATRGQVIRVLGLEAALAAVSGILLGTLISATTLIPFSEAVSQTPVPSGPIWIYLTIVGIAASLTLVSTLVPAWALTRTPPVEAAAVG